MCLAVPMKIETIDKDGIGTGEIEGCRHKVNLMLLENIAEGDYVIVHAGFAIEVLNREEADKRLALFAELAAHAAKEAGK